MKVLLIDDHGLVRSGLRLMLSDVVADVTVTEADSCAQALHHSDKAFDLVLLDMHMPGIDGLEGLRCVKDAWPVARVVVMSGDENAQLIRNAIEMGACGFIPKSSSHEVMVKALQLVLAKGTYLPPQVLMAAAAPAVRPASPGALPAALAVPGMTERQAQVLRLALKGAPNKVIARELAISEGTVKSHLSTVFRLLNVRNRTEALYFVARQDLKV
ncbi:MAG: response regulator transcription factor [Bdellovibrionales bacterium]|nr:response regulator transcription factor [Ramlibacter sp.]